MSQKYEFDVTNSLLTKENNIVKYLVGDRRESLATVIAQLYKCMPHQNFWTKECVGALCFIKDHPAKSYYFRMYCIASNEMIWEHQIYTGIQYLEMKAFFHAFEGEEYIVGFNFANEKEAEKFGKQVTMKFKLFSPTIQVKQKIVEKKKKKSKEKGKKNRTPLVISDPIDFKHLTHVGLDGNWNNDSTDSHVNEIMKKAFSITNTNHVDRATQEFAVEFIKKNIRKKRRAPPPPPQAPKVPLPPKHSGFSSSSNIPPPLPTLNVVPAPTTQNIPPPPPINNIPPPPPIQNGFSLNIPVSPIPSRSVSPTSPSHRFDDPRSELFNSIRSGQHKLKSSKDRELEPKVDDETDFQNDIAKALAVALEKRGKFIKDSDSSEEEIDNSDEWED